MKQLTLTNIYKSFLQSNVKIDVLIDLNFSFDLNKNYAITGASGVGKSTLLQILAGISLPDQGAVCWHNQLMINQLTEAQKGAFWNSQVGFVFQQPNLINELTVLENVLIKGLIARQYGSASSQDCLQQATALLNEMGLGARLNFYPSLLSRGEQQRVAIARALMSNASLILADEPTAALDRVNSTQVLDLLINLSKSQNIGLIMTTHDLAVASKMDYELALLDCKLNLSR